MTILRASSIAIHVLFVIQVVKPEDDDFQEFQDASKSGSLDDSFTDFQGEAAKAASSQHRSRYQVLGVSVISLAKLLIPDYKPQLKHHSDSSNPGFSFGRQDVIPDLAGFV